MGRKRWTAILITACGWVGMGADDTGITKYQFTGYAQGTDYAVTYYAKDRVVQAAAIDSIWAVIDSSMSLYKPYSLINRVNRAAGAITVNDEHFYRVLARSFEIYRDSKGIFDITVAPLVQLWGFGTTPIDRFPDSAAVNQARSCVGMENIRLKGRRLMKRKPCVQLDMNGIAQGYSVDVLAGHLENKGITSYVVELGGELRVKGPKPDGSAIRIGIERPADSGTATTVINDVVELREGAMTTAGNYRKFLQDGARSVSHHINPATGYPFRTEVISATVYAKDAMTADGYDNVIMAMDVHQALDFVDRREDMEVFIIFRDPNGSVQDTMSRGFRELISNR